MKVSSKIIGIIGLLLVVSWLHLPRATAYTVGVEWINDFPGTSGDRDHWDESGDGFYNKLRNSGWTGQFRWTNWSSWEKDFKRSALGGWEESYADNVDIVMLCTHGSTRWDSFWERTNRSVYFGSTVDDRHLVPGDAYRSYGDNNSEWICFDSCSVLADRGYWYTTFNGLHLMLGFANTMYVISYGDGRRWAEYMINDGWWDWPRTITQAWFATVDDLQPQGVKARVLAEVSDNYNDYLWGQGYVSPDPSYNGAYWYWDHTAGSKPPLQTPLDLEKIVLYKVIPKDVTPDYVKKIAEVLTLTGEIGEDEKYYYLQENGEVLTVDKFQGSFRYHNLNTLWTAPPEPPKLPDPAQGTEIAISFLAENGLLPADAFFSETTVEQQVEVKVEESKGSLTEEEIQRIDINLQSEFARQLPLDESGQIMASVMGPGARLKVYIGDGGTIIGAHGGWKDVEPTDTVLVLSQEEALRLLEKYGNKIALAKHPHYDQLEIKRVTLGYYEHAITDTRGQTNLLPTWILEVDFFLSPENLPSGVDNIAQQEPYASGYIYLPAWEGAIPLVCSILNPPDGQWFLKGDPITLKGEAQFGTPPYTYEWYSDADGYLGEGQELNINTLSVVERGGSIVPHTITLEASDDAGGSATADIQVLILPANPPVIEDITFDECISELCTSLISVSAYDPEGGALTYSWEALDGGTIIGSGPEVEFVPPGPSVYPDCDPYRVNVTVTSELTGLFTEETIGIYVKLAGDANGDGVVNTRDQKLVRNYFGQSGEPGWVDADVNCDGIINTRDKKAVRNQFGQTGCSCP